MGKQWKQCQTLFSWAPKSLWVVTAALKLKDTYFLGSKAMKNLSSILKSRDVTLPTKVHLIKAMIFPVVIYGCEKVKVKVARLCLTLCIPMDCSSPGFPVLRYLRSLLKLMSTEAEMPSNHLILCRPLLLLPSILPSIRVFSRTTVQRYQFFSAQPVLLSSSHIHI